MTTTISVPEELLSTRVSWADLSDEEEIPIPKTPTNQWEKPLVIKKELQDKEPEWVSRERKQLQQKTNEKPKTSEKPKRKKRVYKDPSVPDTLSNKSITCRSCKECFVWTIREQIWFKEKGFTAPKTCKPCKVLFKDCGTMPSHKRRITLAL